MSWGCYTEEGDIQYLIDEEEGDPMATPRDADDIRGWKKLWEQIKADLCMANKDNMKLTLTQINQLIIL